MAYDRKFLKWLFIFSVEGTDELAVTGCTTAGTALDYDPVPDLTALTTAQAEGLLEDLRDLMAAATLHWASYSTLEHLKVSAHDVTGAYLTDAREFAKPSGTFTGTAADVPPQLSVVLSLWSGQKLGKGNYGRLFLPHVSMPLPTGSPVASGINTAAVSTAAAAFLGSVNTLAGSLTAAAGLRIMSDGNPSKAVASVRVGGVIDTQRRRRNALAEDYAVTAL